MEGESCMQHNLNTSLCQSMEICDILDDGIWIDKSSPLCPPGSLGPAPFFEMHIPVSHSFVSCTSIIFFVCALQSMIQFAFVHIQFPTLLYLHFKEKSRRKHLIYFCIFSKCILNNRSLFPPDLAMVMV